MRIDHGIFSLLSNQQADSDQQEAQGQKFEPPTTSTTWFVVLQSNLYNPLIKFTI